MRWARHVAGEGVGGVILRERGAFEDVGGYRRTV
jgi:hypothetical protein